MLTGTTSILLTRSVQRVNIRMKNTISNVRTFELYKYAIEKQYQNYCKRYCTDEAYTLAKKKIIHPYRKLHPWKSQNDLSQYLVDNIIYNEDGLVVINKPYGLSTKPPPENKAIPSFYSKIPNQINYTISDCLPFIAKELGYSNLVLVKAPNKFMSGLSLLAADSKTAKAIVSSYERSIGMNLLNRIYWVVTVAVPNRSHGQERLCLRQEVHPSQSTKQVVIDGCWSKNEVKKGQVKLLKVDFNIISNSTYNLSSLIEMKSSTLQWHALRLFASTVLYAPILGDNVYSGRIHKVAGKWLLTNPFVETNNLFPIESRLLEMLHLTREKQELIPNHIHARQVILPNFKGTDLSLVAPLISPLDWTCKQLKFKNIPEFENTKEDELSPVYDNVSL